MNRAFTLAVGGLVLVAAAPVAALAQGTASQRYVVHVPPKVSVRAPADAFLNFDRGAGVQSFPAQHWEVSGNSRGGVTAVFSTDQAFTNAADSAHKRDAAIQLRIVDATGPAVWRLDAPTSQTDYARGNERAVVQASSDSAGQAKFDLNVSFLSDSDETLQDGNYSLTVTATVTSHD
jgi:hypothetical protein